MIIKLSISIMVIFLSACTMEGSVNEKQKNLISECIDTRDGETFYFNTSDIKNVRIGIGADSCFDVIDSNGIDRHLCKSHEQWLKCKRKD